MPDIDTIKGNQRTAGPQAVYIVGSEIPIDGGTPGDTTGLSTLAEQQVQSGLLTTIDADTGNILSSLTAMALGSYLDPNNSTTTLLGANQTFTGQWFDASKFSTIRVSYQASSNGSLVVEQRDSPASPTQTTASFLQASSLSQNLNRVRRWVRILYNNGSNAQTHFALNTIFDPLPLTSVTVSSQSDTELSPPFTIHLGANSLTAGSVAAGNIFYDNNSNSWKTREDSDLICPTAVISAANGPATIIIPQVAGRKHLLKSVLCGYTAAPTGGVLTVTDGAAVRASVPITSEGAAPIKHDVIGTTNTAMTITLSPGGSGVVGHLSVAYREVV